MADQTTSPLPWDDTMSDGCSGVLDLGFTKACIAHDEKYHYGGDIVAKMVADDEFYQDMVDTSGFWGWVARRGLARERYIGVRTLTYNYPPGHSMRRSFHKVEAWNWLGPGMPEKET